MVYQTSDETQATIYIHYPHKIISFKKIVNSLPCNLKFSRQSLCKLTGYEKLEHYDKVKFYPWKPGLFSVIMWIILKSEMTKTTILKMSQMLRQLSCFAFNLSPTGVPDSFST